MRGLEQAVGCVYCTERCCSKPSCRGQSALHPASSAVVIQQSVVRTAGRQRKRRMHRRRRARASRRKKRSAQITSRRQTTSDVVTKDTDLGRVAVAASRCQDAADVVVAAVREDVRRLMQTHPNADFSRQRASVGAAVATQTGEIEEESGAAGVPVKDCLLWKTVSHHQHSQASVQRWKRDSRARCHKLSQALHVLHQEANRDAQQRQSRCLDLCRSTRCHSSVSARWYPVPPWWLMVYETLSVTR